MKPFFNPPAESDGEGRKETGKEGIDDGVPENSMFKISPSLGIIRTLLFLFFFFSLGNVGTSFGLAERGIQPRGLCKSSFKKETDTIYYKSWS